MKQEKYLSLDEFYCAEGKTVEVKNCRNCLGKRLKSCPFKFKSQTNANYYLGIKGDKSLKDYFPNHYFPEVVDKNNKGPRFDNSQNIGDELLEVFKNTLIILTGSFGGCFILGMILYLLSGFGIIGAGLIDLLFVHSDPFDSEPDFGESITKSELYEYYYFSFGLLLSIISLILYHPEILFNGGKYSKSVYYTTIILRVSCVGVGVFLMIKYCISFLGIILAPLGLIICIAGMRRR